MEPVVIYNKESMAQSDNSVGVIILGNSGVGKSFLGNVILGEDVFIHQYRANAVTLKTEYRRASFNRQTYAIYNIPGLIEAEQERIDLNKREIDISFQQHPNAVVLYVFGTNNGRIRNEDVVAFNAINAAYPLSQKSLVIVLNGINPNRPNDYEAQTTITLSGLLKMHIPHLCFINYINQPDEKELLHGRLVETITTAIAKVHKKAGEIDLQAAEISRLTRHIAEFQKQIEQDRERYRLEVIGLKTEFQQREDRQRTEQATRERELRAQQDEMRSTIERQQQEVTQERQRAHQQEERHTKERQQQALEQERQRAQQEAMHRSVEQQALVNQLEQMKVDADRQIFSCPRGHELEWYIPSRKDDPTFYCDVCEQDCRGGSWFCGRVSHKYNMCSRCARQRRRNME